MKALRLAVGLGLLAAATGSWAYTGGAGIAGSPHDFSGASKTTLLQWLDSTGAVTTYTTTTPNCVAAGTPGAYANAACASGFQGTVKVTIGLCTKCHTAHKAKTTALLWNHTLNQVQYSWDDPTTTAGTKYATFKGDTYKGPTPKCLSCHDGFMSSTDGMWFNRQSTTGTKYVAPVGSLDSGHEVADGATGSMVGTHPVAMPYPLNNAVSSYNGTTNNAMALGSGWVADPSKTNNIMLYTDNGAGYITRGSTTGQSGIECGSCHDVHNGKRVPTNDSTTTPVLLLTGLATGSSSASGGYICNQCHVK